MRRFMFALAAVLTLVLSSASARASVLTGAYDPATSSGSQTVGTGPYTLVSSNSAFSILRFIPTTNPLFGELTNLFVNFTSPELNANLPGVPQSTNNTGGGVGAPRLVVSLDTNNNLSNAEGRIEIQLGTSPGYVDTPAQLNVHSGMNLIGNNDAGRYDLSFAPTPGSPFTDYNAALAAWASARVIRFSVILDSFNADKTLIVNEIGAAAEAQAAVPEPMSALVWSTLALTVGAVVSRRRRPANS